MKSLKGIQCFPAGHLSPRQEQPQMLTPITYWDAPHFTAIITFTATVIIITPISSASIMSQTSYPLTLLTALYVLAQFTSSCLSQKNIKSFIH